MTMLLVVIFAALVALAAAFAVWPVLRGARGWARALPAAALILFVAGIGAGAYLMLGRPELALRTLEGDRVRDIDGLISRLVPRLRAAPVDERGWTMLGRSYLTVGDAADAAKAFARAIGLARASGRPNAELYSAYGEAAVAASGNAVTQEAQAAFAQALALNPRDRAALYFMGSLYAARGENARAVAAWRNLLDESPANAPYRQELIDRIAMLTSSSAAVPDVGAMVASLAARLKARGDDPAGWQKLIRAYAVLGDGAKAAAVLTEARAAMARRPDVLASLSAEAKELKLEK